MNLHNLYEVVSKLVDKRWFESSESSRTTSEAVIQEYLSDIGAGQLTIRWLDKQKLAGFIHDYELIKDPIWSHLYEVPQRIYEAAETKGMKESVAFMMNDVPELLFHAIYDGAFKAFEEQGEQVISHTVAAALYITSLHISWDAVCDQPNPLAKLYEVLCLGYLPLGAKDGVFHVY
jgi:hypothetical protein